MEWNQKTIKQLEIGDVFWRGEDPRPYRLTQVDPWKFELVPEEEWDRTINNFKFVNH